MSYALNSLIEILDQILNPQKHHKNWVLDDEDKEIQTLMEKACFVRDFLAKPPPSISQDDLETLEEEIISKAEEAENTLESYITELILSSTDHQVSFTISPPDDLGEPFDEIECQINDFIDAANRKTPDVNVDQVPDDDGGGDADLQGLDDKQAVVSSMRNHEGKLIVGLEQDLSDLNHRLTARSSSKVEIISIVGKLGTGKTTLAHLIYHRHSSTTQSHFDYCLWATVPRDSNSKQIREGESKETKWKEILQSLLACVLTKSEQQLLTEEGVQKKPVQLYNDLLTSLHKKLFHRRCLIVLDGIQDITDWDKVKLAFMKAIHQGSRILLTTRKHSLADYVKSQIHHMRPLSNEECWELLREKVYGNEICPYDLEKVGRRIASNCKSLPLEVEQVGTELSNVEKQKDLWEEFAVSLKSRNLVVGVDGDLMVLKHRLLGKNTGLEIIPIVGMGGTGKTTLARVLFDELSLDGSLFEVRAWTTISQTYDPRRVLQSLLDCVAEKPMHVQEVGELINTLHQYLLASRYLLLLDDIWNSKPLEDLRAAFPDNKKGSRIIFTTRIKEWDPEIYAHSHEMKPLKNNDSWELLRRKVFDNEFCPAELEEIGKQIAENKCRGLPLAVQVVGGLLSQAERSKSSWEKVAENVSSFIEKEDEQFSGIFSWSYFHLPHHLKPCLLYMGSFPEDYEIRASKLIKLWVSDGFLSPFKERSPEEAAEMYLTDLVDRSLILVRERKENLKVKSYGIHDLLRDMCLKKAQEKKFVHVRDLTTNNLEGDFVRDQRRVSVHSSSEFMEDNDSTPGKLMQHVRSFQAIGPATERILSCLCFESSLLRQLNLFETEFLKFPEEILKLVNLRYLALRCVSGLPESIYVLRNLQNLIIQIRGECYFPLGIFDVPQISHVDVKGTKVLMKPVDRDRSLAVQRNLQSLMTVPLGILKHLMGKTPKLRKLGVYSSGLPEMVDLTCFEKLESLKCSSDMSPESNLFLSKLRFTHSLQKVSLRRCILPGTCLRKLGLLPNLIILKLEGLTMESTTWETSEDEFWKLQFLVLEDLNLVTWLWYYTHCLELRKLVVRRCSALEMIPQDIGAFRKLDIVVDGCSDSVVESANRILSKQQGAPVQFLLDNMAQPFVNHVDLINGADSELVELHFELKRLKSHMAVALKYKRDDTLTDWVREIRELVYDIEDIIDTLVTLSAQEARRKNIFSRLFKSKRLTLAQEVQGLRKDKVLPLLNKLEDVTFPDSLSTHILFSLNKSNKRQTYKLLPLHIFNITYSIYIRLNTIFHLLFSIYYTTHFKSLTSL